MEYRNYKFDIVRGVAMCMVVASHIVYSESVLHHFLYAIHNSLFFLISGYLFYNSYETKLKNDWMLFFKSKIVCLVIPYLVWSIVALLAHIVTESNYSVDNLLYWVNITIVRAGSIWFFAALFDVYIIFFVFLKLLNKNYIGAVVFAAIVVCLPNNFFALGRAKWMVPIFVVGFVMAKFRTTIENYISKFEIASILWIPMAIGGGTRAYLCDKLDLSVSFVLWWIYYIIIAILGFVFFAYLICPLLCRWKNIEKIFVEVGQNTIAIYPISIFFTQYLIVFFGVIGFDILKLYDSGKYVEYYLIVAVWTLISVMGSYVIDWVLKRIYLYRVVSRGKVSRN